MYSFLGAPFRLWALYFMLFHSWIVKDGFDDVVKEVWVMEVDYESYLMIRFNKCSFGC